MKSPFISTCTLFGGNGTYAPAAFASALISAGVFDGVAEFTLHAAWLDAFAFAFAGEGSADLFGFAAPVSMAVSFR